MALLVIKVTNKNNKEQGDKRKGWNTKREGWVVTYNTIEHKKKASPIRFINKVNNPEKTEDWFW